MPPRDSDDCLAGLNISDDDTSGSYHDIFPYMDPLYYGGVCADMAVVPNERQAYTAVDTRVRVHRRGLVHGP